VRGIIASLDHQLATIALELIARGRSKLALQPWNDARVDPDPAGEQPRAQAGAPGGDAV